MLRWGGSALLALWLVTPTGGTQLFVLSPQFNHCLRSTLSSLDLCGCALQAARALGKPLVSAGQLGVESPRPSCWLLSHVVRSLACIGVPDSSPGSCCCTPTLSTF